MHCCFPECCPGPVLLPESSCACTFGDGDSRSLPNPSANVFNWINYTMFQDQVSIISEKNGERFRPPNDSVNHRLCNLCILALVDGLENEAEADHRGNGDRKHNVPHRQEARNEEKDYGHTANDKRVRRLRGDMVDVV